MILTINSKEYPLHFGFAFLKYINKHNGLEVEDMNMGVGGMQKLTVGMSMNDPETLITIIKGATDTEKQKPSDSELESYLMEIIENESYSDVFAELETEIKKQPILSQAMKQKNQA